MSVLSGPWKANVVADVLSRMCMGSVAHVADGKELLVKMCIGWSDWVFDLKILEKRVLWFIITLNNLS